MVHDAFLPLYHQLRAIAQARLSGAGVGTLQATAVVHEALMRLSNRPADSFVDDKHLLATAAQAIRHVVVDYARRKNANKRQGSKIESLQDADQAVDEALGMHDPHRAALVLDVDRAMDTLGETDDELRTIVELHVFGGMEHAEIAVLMEVSERTVRRRWQFASALLRKHLQDWMSPTDEPQAE